MHVDYGSCGRIGLLLPSANRAAEPQLRAMLPAQVALATTRLKLADARADSLLRMAEQADSGAELLADAGVDLVVFHCTAVSTYSEELEQSILARVRAAAGVPAIATSQALVQGLRRLAARRIVMLSPYPEEVNAREAAYFRQHGFEVASSGGRVCADVPQMMSITPDEWVAMAVSHAAANADAYVLSCTTTRAAEAAEVLERRLERPVITSNTAVAWACMKALDLRQSVPGFGTLLADASNETGER